MGCDSPGDAERLQFWGWEDTGPAGRDSYVYQMAVWYFRALPAPVPPELQEAMVSHLLKWGKEIDAMCPEDVASHTVTNEDDSARRRAATAPDEVLAEDVPADALLDDYDRQVVWEAAVRWPGLPARYHDALVHRLAVTFVAEKYGGAVPRGLIDRTVATVSQCKAD